jgi:histidine triad (HIT) family protein
MTRTHAENILELGEDDIAAAMATVRRVVHRMRDTLNPDGFNILHNIGPAAWQSIFHFHMHVIPRYKDDPLHLPWIPEPADPEELKRVAAEIRG